MQLWPFSKSSPARPRGPAELRLSDMPFVSAVSAAQVVEPAPAAMYAVYLLLGALATAVTWASMAQVDIIAKANGRVVPDGKEQIIASLEGGLLREMLVREGQQVQVGQALARLDPTRASAQQAEGQAKRLALLGTLTRLQAEAEGHPLKFGAIPLPADVVADETASYQARQGALQQALQGIQRNQALLQRELALSQRMSARGLMSEVEVMRLSRQVNDLTAQSQERINRFRQEASGELVKVRTELAQMQEQMVVRDDTVKRSTLFSPVRGVVKQIRANTIGGVISAGAPVMEVLPLGDKVLVEARVRPADIGFVKVGQPVMVKLSAYEYTVYGGLSGVVQSISPDALGDPERAATADGTWYRALVLTDSPTLAVKGKPRDSKAVEGAATAGKPADAQTAAAARPQLAVLPGMTGSVEIRTGQRNVLAYLLLPMMKSQEAFRER